MQPEQPAKDRVQVACDRCTHGVMDSTNPHLSGECGCECHAKEPSSVTGRDFWGQLDEAAADFDALPAWMKREPQPSARGRLLAIARRELADHQVTPGEAHEILVALQKEEARAGVLAAAVAHVLRYGKVGKQSETRLRAALRAVEADRG